MSDMFRPFRHLLHKIKSLLWTLDRRELMALEKLLCSNEDISNLANWELPTGKFELYIPISFEPSLRFCYANAHFQ